MNKETAQSLLMDYLYDEITEADKKKLEAYLAKHPEMHEELDQLRSTRSLLQKMPDAEPAEKLRMMEPEKDTAPGWMRTVRPFIPKSGWARTALATAACLMLLLVTGALVDLNIQSSEAGFSVQFGTPPVAQPADLSEAQVQEIENRIQAKKETGLTKEQVQEMVNQIQRENTALLTEYADMLNKHNTQQLRQVVEYFNQKRLNDLQMIDKALNQYQEKTDYQLQQTQQVLGDFIQTVAAKN